MKIEEHQTHYAFGERFPRDRPGPLLTEFLSLTVWGTVVSPKEKKGRDMQAMITDSERFAHPMPSAPPGAEPPVIGELHWGAARVARLYVPPTTIWPLGHAIAAGHLKRLSVKVDGPLRGTMPIRGVHATTRAVQIRLGKRVIGEAEDEEEDEG